MFVPFDSIFSKEKTGHEPVSQSRSPSFVNSVTKDICFNKQNNKKNNSLSEMMKKNLEHAKNRGFLSLFIFNNTKSNFVTKLTKKPVIS